MKSNSSGSNKKKPSFAAELVKTRRKEYSGNKRTYKKKGSGRLKMLLKRSDRSKFS